MRTISTVFGREIGAFLRNPVGWIVWALMLFIDGVLFQWIISKPKYSFAVMREYLAWTGALVVVAGLILSVWLITKERASGTIVLYRTSPAKEWQVVVGKYLAALLLLALMVLSTLYIPILIEGKIAQGQILVGYIGLMMLGAVSVAIGLFASSLSSNIVVSIFIAIATTVFLVLASRIALAMDAPLDTLFTEIDMWWIRYERGTAQGILSLSNVVYYGSLVYLFLLLATKTMGAKQWK